MNTALPLSIAQALAPLAPRGSVVHQIMRPRFAVTHCSQCGQSFGSGPSGFSHCADHAPTSEPEEGYCSACAGSGEGLWEGDVCRVCKGSGMVWYPAEVA